MKECDLLLGGAYLLAMDGEDTRIRDGGVAVSGGKLLAVDEWARLKGEYHGLEEIYHPHSVVLPGLINAHTHETLTRGLAEDRPLMRWLEEFCYPVEGAYTPEDLRAAAEMVQLELIQGGVTCFADLFRFADQAAEVALQSGLRAILAPQFFDATSQSLESIEKTEALIRRYNGADNGRIQIWFGPHSPYSCGPASYRRAAELAARHGVGIHTHLCETREELAQIRSRYGTDPVEYLREAGVLDVPCILAHAIHLTKENMELLAAKRATAGLVYNPVSNMKLADGIAKIPALQAAGCVVGLGTDSTLSSNALDLFEVMRVGSYLQKTAEEDATALPCYEMLRMATRGSAEALRLDKQIGSLEPGKQADVIAVSLLRPHLWPLYYDTPNNIVEQLVYAANAGDVITTVAGGKVLMDNRKVRTLDAGEIFEHVQARAKILYANSFPARPH